MMNKTKIMICEEKEIEEVKNQCVPKGHLLVACIAENFFPAITITPRLFRQLHSAHESDSYTESSVAVSKTSIYPRLLIRWNALNEEVHFTFDSQRDYKWLEVLCQSKKLLLVVKGVANQAILVDEIDVEALLLAIPLAIFNGSTPKD